MFDAKTIRLAESLRPDLDFSVMGTEQFAILKIVENASGGGVEPIRDAVISNGIAYFDRVTASQPLVSLKLNIPVTQTGSGTPSPTNIRDFVGVTGAVIGQTSGYGEYFKGLLNGTYGFVDLGSLTWRQSEAGTPNMFYYVSLPDYKFISNNPNTTCDKYERANISVSTTDEGYAIYSNGLRLRIRDTDYSTVEDFTTAVTGHYLIYELAEPSTPVTPEQFATLCQAFGITGNTYTISFGQTVYSAILDVLNGKLYLTHEIKTIDENSGVVVSSTNNNVYICDDVFNIDEDTESINCNVYQRGENRQSISGVVNNNPDLSFCCKLGTNPTRLLIKDTRFTSTEDYNTWLANNPVKIAVKLAEPIEVQLTEPTQITTLIGDNVIFADVGDITECKYTRK